ncbi:hypothetical protein [Kitasatospora sp. NPDC059673]|uniref:hypothetical protein n=1 Tax=Kitasatospora sp. NPDC059673 TaxID=3346901 RepID=UPI0036AA1B03
MTDGTDFRAALLLAAIRATGQMAPPRDTTVTARAAQAAVQAGRTLLELRGPAGTLPTLRLGWPTGSAPNDEHLADQLPPALPPVVTLVWALCVKAAWPDPSVPLYPGLPFSAARIEEACSNLGADPKRVTSALERVLPEHALIVRAGRLLHLGPAVATLPDPVVAALRRGHHRLPAVPPEAPPPTQASDAPMPPLDLGPADTDPAPGTGTDQIARSTVTALEAARGPLPPRHVTALADPHTKARIEQILQGTGRNLLHTPSGSWTTGYPDRVADALATAGIGTLPPTERAVLALVLIHTVALPRARGRHTHPHWNTTAHPVTANELARNRALSRTEIDKALRTLRGTGMVDIAGGQGQYVPGPALQRLSPARAAALWEDLILAGRPGGHLARAITERRATHHDTLIPGESQ